MRNSSLQEVLYEFEFLAHLVDVHQIQTRKNKKPKILRLKLLGKGSLGRRVVHPSVSASDEGEGRKQEATGSRPSNTNADILGTPFSCKGLELSPYK